MSIVLMYAGLSGLILLALSARVGVLRRRYQVGIGVGEQRALELAVRAQANFCEYVPLTLVLLFGLELAAAAPGIVVHGLGACLILGRVMHGFFGLNRSAGVSFGRFYGTVLTWLVLLCATVLAVWQGIG